MQRYLRYGWYVVCHKWYVFLAACRLGIPWRGLMHDLSKFRPDEFIPYARHFYAPDGAPREVRDATGYYKPTGTGDPAFDRAWLKHQHRNEHHWQHWVLAEDEGGVKVLPMPHAARLEMISDWLGAGRALGTPDVQRWYQANGHKMRLAPETRGWVEEKLRTIPTRRRTRK